ncbi:MAG: N-acetyl-alpha-D-glucosaminyl L-malate synthase BshA [Deltaproteobacteria bacterium]|nr:N-acetyl-alpha-D-glucosaminyl L-malate synthase BshA [Deltaproteobacteria bacterium]
MSHLSIGIVCYPSLGGSGVVAAELAAGLAERGHRVHLIAAGVPGRAPLPAGVRLHTVAVPEYPLFSHAPYEMAVAGAIVAVARQHGLDIVNVHYAVPHASSADTARRVLGAAAPRCVVTLHGTDVTRVGREPSIRAVTRYAIAAADRITVPSAYLREAAAELLGAETAAGIAVLPNFVDTELFRPAPEHERGAIDALFGGAGGGPTLIHVSTFRPVKRAADLIELLARVRRSLPARLVLVGDGPDRAATVAQAAARGLADCVRSLGAVADLPALLRQADAFVLTSESESFGVAALEALSSGVPVFAYRVGGLPEVVGDGCGALVAPFDVAALAQAVVGGLRQPSHLRAQARAHAVAHFARAAAIDRYEACFDALRRGVAAARRGTA